MLDESTAGPRVPETALPRRVALFTGAYNHIADGVALTLNRVVADLEAHGVETRVFAPTVPRPAIPHAGTLVPVPSIQMPGRPEYRIATGLPRDARHALERFAPDLVSISTPDLLGLGARRWARRAGVPLVGIYHTHFASYLSFYGMGWAEGMLWRYLRRFYRPFEHVYVPSTSMGDVLRAHGMGHNLRSWARGLDTGRFAPTHRDAAWRRSLGFADGLPVVLWTGRLVAEKRPDVFADAVARMRADGLHFGALVVGDGPERATFEAALPGGVFTGTLRGEDLARAYASADVFLFPSASETFGNVTLEAMASGLPTVCADAPGSASLVKDGATGSLCPTGDAAAFAEATGRLVTDVGLRRQMAGAAFDRARTFRWDAVLARFRALLAEAAAPHDRYDGAHQGGGDARGLLTPVSTGRS